MVGFVYIIGPCAKNHPKGPFKIGSSVDVERRLLTFQMGCPFKLHVHHKRLCETVSHALCEYKAHDVLSFYRSHGEWFAVDIILARMIVDTIVDRDDTPNLIYRELEFQRACTLAGKRVSYSLDDDLPF